ncbi:MAG: tRNA lysidine(34) synthetase TilS [Planctomycetota bacterium]
MSDPGQSNTATAWIRRVRTSWRQLTGAPGRGGVSARTLVAVSGGADSAALAIALGTLSDAPLVLAHVAHDMRPAEIVHDDRAAVESLALRLGQRVVAGHARSLEGNAEHAARRSRYRELEFLAREHGCGYIATGHHAYDQAETLLLAMLRGGGPRALLGIRESRPAEHSPGLTVVRPALQLLPSGAAAVCGEFGFVPRVDATNADPSRARARLRANVIPGLSGFGGEAFDLGAMLARTIKRLEDGLGQSALEQLSDVGLECLDA